MAMTHGASALLIVCAVAGAGSGRAHAEPEPYAGDDGEREANEPEEEIAKEEIAEEEIARVPGEVIDIRGEAPPSAIIPSARTIDAAELALTPTRHPDDLLALMPGLEIGRHGAEGKGAEIFVRGFDAVHGADLEVRVAGVPVNEMSNIHGQGYLDLGFLIPEVVRGVRMRKGSLGLDQGRFATAGTAEFELGVPADEVGYQAGYEIGSTNRHRAAVVAAPSAGEGSTFIAAEAMRDSGFGSGRAARRATALGQGRVALAEGGFAKIVGGAFASRFGEGGPVPLADYDAGRLDFHDTYGLGGDGQSQRAFVSGRAQRPLGDHRLEVEAHGQARRLDLDDNFTGFFVDPELGDRQGEEHAFLGGGLRARYLHALPGDADIDAGIDLIADRFEQSRDHLDQGGDVIAPELAVAGSHMGAGAHLGLTYRTETVHAEAGARADALRVFARDELGAETGSGSAVSLSPRLAAAVTPGEAWTLSAGYGHGVRPPEATGGLGDEALSWVSSRAVDVGARYRPENRLEVSVTGFGIFIPSELIYDHVTREQVDEGATRRLGVELAAHYEPAPWLALRADATAVSARFRDDGEPIPGPASLLGTLEARAHHPGGWRGGARLRARGPRPLGFGAQADPSAAVDVVAGYDWGDLAFDLTVENATGARLADGAYYYASRFDRDAPLSQLPELHYTAGPPRIARLALTYAF